LKQANTTDLASTDAISPETARKFIVIEGPIGVGKSSLAKKMAHTLDSPTLLEKPAENPFLERFYKSPKRYALPTQLFFLFQRVRQLSDLKQEDLFSPGRVADFMLEKDPLFAQITLDDDEFRLYQILIDCRLTL